MRNEFGIVEVNSMADLLKEIKIMLPYTTVSLVGPSGTGKTELVQRLIHDPEMNIDELVILRLQGLSSEDFRIPLINTVTVERADGTITTEKQVDLIQMGIFKEIDANPNKQYCLFLDEYIRASRDVSPLLFSLLEGKMFDGIKRPNLKVITAFNYGGDYECNIDLSDDALRRRQIFIQYNPAKQDFLDYIAKKQYNDILQEVVEYLPVTSIVDHETTKELEQPTTFGSWSLLNERWKQMALSGRFDYKEAKLDVATRGSLFFTDKTCHDLSQKLTLLEELNTIDIQKEIIDKNGLHSGKPVLNKQGTNYDIKNREKEILIKVINFVRREVMVKDTYLTENITKLFKVFEGENTLVISMFKQIHNDVKRMFNDTQAKEKQAKERAVFLGIVKAIQTEMKENESMSKLWEEFQFIYSEMNRG